MKRRDPGPVAALAWLGVVTSLGSPGELAAQSPTLRELPSGTDALLQAVSAPSDEVLWISGHDGAVLRSLDAGAAWSLRPVPGGDSLQFRDVHAFDADRAVILSAGPGASSRVYRTDDGGATWSLAWVNPEQEGFYDCLDFWDDRRGVLYGDAVAGGLRILVTEDGGAIWRRVAPERLPAPAGSEGGFAASGTCVETGPGGRGWIGTGAGDRARILSTADFGRSWVARDLPLVTGEAAGAFTVVFEDGAVGYVLGGDLAQADGYTDNVARTADGGASWTLVGRPPFPGAVYGAALSAGPEGPRLWAAGPGGLASSSDGATSWVLLDDRTWWAVGTSGNRAWVVGPGGRVAAVEDRP